MCSDMRMLRVAKGANSPIYDDTKPHLLEIKHQVSVKCSRCKVAGHNKRSCKAQVPESTANPAPNTRRKRAATNVETGQNEAVPNRAAGGSASRQRQAKRSKLNVQRSYSQTAYMGDIGSMGDICTPPIFEPPRSSKAQTAPTSPSKQPRNIAQPRSFSQPAPSFSKVFSRGARQVYKSLSKQPSNKAQPSSLSQPAQSFPKVFSRGAR